tara:strand:- start:21378 stop:22124 length:747 start_codon:yes stop_codon:yes gene_type:complete
MQFDLEQVYHTYLNKEQELNGKKYEKFKGWFGASSAGSCFRKQLHRARGDSRTEIKPRNMRLLRLGTIVHNDLEAAVSDYINVVKPKNMHILLEHRIVLKELNVLGHLDLCTYTDNNNKISNLEVWDYKTCGTYKWRLKYGRGAINKIDRRYAMQVATYGMGMCEQLGTTTSTLGLLWYNKDTSSLRKEFIPDTFMDEAHEYWTELNEVSDEVEKPEDLQVGDVGVPFENWECRYCDYQGTLCPGLTR